MTIGTRSAAELDCPRDFLADHAPHAATDELNLHGADGNLAPFSRASRRNQRSESRSGLLH